MAQQVVAEWAWITKEPGSREDYGILAASTGPMDIEGFVGVYVAGVPSSSLPQSAPTAPPWVTFGAHPTHVDRPMLSVSVQDPWHGQDQAKRPIWPRRFFLCQYGDLAAARTSYRALWDAVAPLGLPRPDYRPVPVAIRPQPLSDVVAAINDIGFDRVAAIAASLLDGPVAVTDTVGLRLADPAEAVDRLAVLERGRRPAAVRIPGGPGREHSRRQHGGPPDAADPRGVRQWQPAGCPAAGLSTHALFRAVP